MLTNISFAEVPLCQHDGRQAGLVDGAADIHYQADGSWQLHNIQIMYSTYGLWPEEGPRGPAEVLGPAPDALATIITDYLSASRSWRAAIERKVFVALRAAEEAGDADARIDAAKEAAL